MRNTIVEEDLEQIIQSRLPWDNFAGKTVLITGANGFIAAYLVETLLYLNEKRKKGLTRVICLVRNRSKAVKRFSHYRGRRDVSFVIQDVCDPIKLNEDVDYVIHAASHATPAKYGIDPVGILLPNVIGTYRLLEFVKLKKVKAFLFVSSGEIYSSLPLSITNIKETDVGRLDPLGLRAGYAESKRMGETMCMSWFRQHRIPVKIVRLFHTYGPGMLLHDGRVHSDFVGDIVVNKNIVIKSKGNATRTFSYIADTTTAILTVLLKGVAGEAYNVGSNRNLTIQKFAETLISLYPDKKLKIVKDLRNQGKKYLPSTNRSLRPNVSKLINLGWKPQYLIKKGLHRTVSSYLKLT